MKDEKKKDVEHAEIENTGVHADHISTDLMYADNPETNPTWTQEEYDKLARENKEKKEQ